MSLNSEGDLIFAANAATDLAQLVTRYLSVYRKHVNGMNGITVPSSFQVVIHQPELINKLPAIAVTLMYTHTNMHSVPQYYDTEDEGFSEAWGSSNVSHYTTETSYESRALRIAIPCGHLLMAQPEQEEILKAIKARKDAAAAEAERQAAIAKLKKELAELEQGKPVV